MASDTQLEKGMAEKPENYDSSHQTHLTWIFIEPPAICWSQIQAIRKECDLTYKRFTPRATIALTEI